MDFLWKLLLLTLNKNLLVTGATIDVIYTKEKLLMFPPAMIFIFTFQLTIKDMWGLTFYYSW